MQFCAQKEIFENKILNIKQIGNQLSHFQNDYFFKFLWQFHEPHN